MLVKSTIIFNQRGTFRKRSNVAGCFEKKVLKPAAKRKMVNDLQQVWSVSELRACHLLKISRTTYRYKSHRSEQTLLRMRIREIAYSRVRYS